MNRFDNIDCMIGMAEYEDNHFDLAITDPPYNVDFKYNGYNDKRLDYKEWCTMWLKELQRVTKYLVCISSGIVNVGMWHKIERPKWIACWYKPATMGRGFLGFNNWEPIMIYGKAYKQTVDVIKAVIIPDKEIEFHPCPKPLNWAKGQLNNFGEIGMKVLDPFAGSGTTLIACEDMGFEYVGFELDEDYYNGAQKRLAQFRSEPKLDLPKAKTYTQETLTY